MLLCRTELTPKWATISMNIQFTWTIWTEAFRFISHSLSSAFSDMVKMGSTDGFTAAFDMRMSIRPYFCKNPQKSLLYLVLPPLSSTWIHSSCLDRNSLHGSGSKIRSCVWSVGAQGVKLATNGYKLLHSQKHCCPSIFHLFYFETRISHRGIDMWLNIQQCTSHIWSALVAGWLLACNWGEW